MRITATKHITTIMINIISATTTATTLLTTIILSYLLYDIEVFPAVSLLDHHLPRTTMNAFEGLDDPLVLLTREVAEKNILLHHLFYGREEERGKKN